MTAARLTLLVALLGLVPHAHAGLTEERAELPTCTLQLRVVKGPAASSGPHFVMMDGVPLSGAVLVPLAERLAARLGATSTLIDFPGVGRSALRGDAPGWAPLRECLRAYLATQPPHTFVLADLAMPVIAPLLGTTPQIRRLVVMNSVLTPSRLRPPFPLSFLRCCPRLAPAVGAVMPDALFDNRIAAVGLGRPETISAEQIRALTIEMRQNDGLKRLATLLSGIELDLESDRQVRAGLATPIPQLYLWGEADPALGAEHKTLQPLAPHQRLVLIPEARHYLMMDFADESAAAIVAWHVNVPGGNAESALRHVRDEGQMIDSVRGEPVGP